MKILHVVPGLNKKSNGIAVAAKRIAEGQRKNGHEVDVVDTREFVSPLSTSTSSLHLTDEVWVHSLWLPMTMKACWRVLRVQTSNHSTPTPNIYTSSRPRLVRMTHGCLDPLRLRSKGWKKRLVSPLERWFFKRTDRVIVTCSAEAEWCRAWGVKGEIEVMDVGKLGCWDVEGEGKRKSEKGKSAEGTSLHVLFLGRAEDPLKGVRFLERAVQEINEKGKVNSEKVRMIDLKVVCDHFGEELERDWEWCDVLCLPTLSENFGLVVAEALERGKRVITTDGAPAWETCAEPTSEKGKVKSEKWRERLVYLRGFRDGTDETRVRLLKEALLGLRKE